MTLGVSFHQGTWLLDDKEIDNDDDKTMIMTPIVLLWLDY